MERNREARRVSMAAAAANGLASRRRHRSGSSLRDSPEDDGPMELQETARLRDRGTVKKDRDRDRERDSRDRERDHRERERDRDRDRMSSRGKRRRGVDRMMNREDGGGGGGGDDSSEESVNDDEDDEDDDGGLGSSSMRMLPPNPSSSLSNHHNHHHHRKSFPPPPKVMRTSPAAAAPWKAPDEMIGVSVPRKARSAHTKRSHEWASSCGVGPEQINRQASTSPARSSGQNVAAMLASASASPAPVSPSSSNASTKKKMKPNGPKQRPPKSSSKFTSSAQDEIEIEIAEVLYGLMRQGPAPKVEIVANDSMRFDSREVSNSRADAKSRVSSPISNSQSTHQHSSAIPPTNSSSSMSAIAAPKRKRPRPVKYEDENPSIYPARSSPISSTVKVDNDQTTKTETSSPYLEKNPGSAENGVPRDSNLPTSVEPLSQPELVKSENNRLTDSKPSMQESESRDLAGNKESPRSPKKESAAGDDRETRSNPVVFEIETQREKYQIDLMAPPPLRSSPERDSETDYVAVDPKPDVAMEIKPAVKEDDKVLKIGKDVIPEAKIVADVAESQKGSVISSRERTLDLHLDLEKSDSGNNLNGSANKIHHNVQKQHQANTTDKTAQSNCHPLPMSMATWPGGLPHMGYMAPLQGVVSMDGNAVPPAAIQQPHLLFNQPRPKRCATHCYIARNINCHQQFAKINPFWSAAAGPALQYGAKACNVNVLPSTDLHPGRGGNSVKDLAIFPGHSGKEKSSQNTNIVDAAQRKQILLQQQLPPGATGAPNNMLHGPTFIFPLNQQQAVAAAAAASVRPGNVKSPAVPSNASSSGAANSASTSGTSTAVAGATAMSFNYPNMPGSETQYLAILQNSAYPIPIPAHVGASPSYRGTPPQAMPFFNGSFYSSQMLHPQQLQQQQSSSQHTQQGQQGHQNPSISASSSSSQKHLQNQQHRSHNTGVNGGSGTLQGFPTSKNQPSQSMQRQQMQNQNAPHHSEESPSTADSRVSHTNMSIYGQNFAMPIHAPNYAMMSQATAGGATAAGSNHGEKKQQQAQQSSKIGVEPSQAFAMSFASINGATAPPGSIDISSFAQNHAILQSLPDAARHGYHFMTAAAVAQAAQQKKNHRVSEEGKSGGNDSSNLEEERKSMSVGKAQTSGGQSTFSWPDLTEAGNAVIDSSARTLNLGNAPARGASGSIMSATMSGVNASSMQQQMQRNHQQQQQQQQMIQLQKQQQFAAAAAASARSKTPVPSNGSVYSDHISSSSPMVAKFSNTLSGFSPSMVQGSSSPGQSPQWKNAIRTTSSQVPSPSSLASTSSSLKNLPQQQGRMPNQHGHTQISFAANPKQSGAGQGQGLQAPNGSQSPSPPMVVGSPSTSSMSKSAGGSPRTTSTSTSNKVGQSSATLSSQQAKNSPSVSAQKSSPVGGRTIPSILGHPHNTTSSSNSAVKSQLQQQQQQHLQQQQQLAKHSMQQQQYYGGYMQAQVQHAANSAHASAAASGFYLQRHRSDQQQQQQQHQQGQIMTSSGMLLCPSVSLGTNDPAKAAAAAASNMKGGNITSQGLIHAQFAAAQQSSGKPHMVPAAFPYVTMPAAVQVKPAEQKQPAAE
ncbi:time for coffee [Euphorbia peplus]|nr:time for coffee [Euphorbia peplus]